MVTRAGQQEPLEADIRMALSRAGYVGDATITALPASLRSELEVLRDTGAPAHGAGGGAFAQPTFFRPAPGPRTIHCSMAAWPMVLVLEFDEQRQRSTMHALQKGPGLVKVGSR